MNPNRDYGRTEPGPVHILPELLFDLSEGESLPANLGQTEVPVVVLPEVVFDLLPKPVPSLQLTVFLRPEATPGQVALDLFRLYTAMNQLELTHRGAGLAPDDASSEGTPSNGMMRITFKPVEPDGAAERLAAIVTAIGEAQTEYSSIERCEATVLTPAV
jgi:hypothetical protein